MVISAFITHKKAEHFSDCQDRFKINPLTKSIALSDGMSQSIFQKYWAEILVDKFTSTPDWVPNLASIKELGPTWRDKVSEVIQQLKNEGNRSAWRAERNLKSGLSAGATFLGIRFKNYEWECDVLGDSCLILIRDNKIKQIIPSEESTVFDSYPDYFDSNPTENGKGTPQNVSGIFEAGDTILLVSDPFSDYLFRKRNAPDEATIVDKLLGINSHSEFEDVVEDLRNNGMHNDDSTLIIIKSDDADSLNIVYQDDIFNLIEQEKNELKNLQNEVADTASRNIKDKENPAVLENTETASQLDAKKETDINLYFNEDFNTKLEKILRENLGFFSRNKEKKLRYILNEINNLISQTLHN